MKKPSSASLRTAIMNAARKVFAEIRTAHPDETFYAYALYTNGEADSIAASANTEEGLIRRAKQYEAREKKGVTEQARTLRWNTPDWAYHCIGEPEFETAQKLLDAAREAGDKGIDDYEQQVEARLAMFVDALKALDAEGCFGRGAARQKITLLVTTGDQEVKQLLKGAEQLNPAKVFQTFSKPFLRPTAGKLKALGSRKVYESTEIAISRSGNLLACAGSMQSGWPCIFAFSLPAQKEVLRLVISETIGLYGIAVSPDGTNLIAGWQSLRTEKDAGIRCWDVRTKKVKWNAKVPGGVWCLDLSPDGTVVASGGATGLVGLWDAQSGKLIRTMSGHKDWVQSVRFSPAASILASSERGENIRLWDCDSGKQIGKIPDSGDAITFSPDGKYLAVAPGAAEDKKEVSIWEVNQHKLIAKLDAVTKSQFQVIQGPDDYQACRATGVAYSPDGRFLSVVRSWPGSVVLWDWKKNQELTWMNPDYDECLNGAVVLPDGQTVAVAGRSMSGPPLLLWDISEVTNGK